MQQQIVKKYRHLFFDLDNTLLDSNANARETLYEIIKEMELEVLVEQFEKFIRLFLENNEKYWLAYRNGLANKETLRLSRFTDTLRFFGIEQVSVGSHMAELYMEQISGKSNLFPGVRETLDYLKEKYMLYIITNGFMEIQTNKIMSSGIGHYFRRVFMADRAGYQKPDKRFFHHALSAVNAKKSESIMIGDDLEADIQGAREAGIDQVFFNPSGKTHSTKTTYEIRSISELKMLFL